MAGLSGIGSLLRRAKSTLTGEPDSDYSPVSSARSSRRSTKSSVRKSTRMRTWADPSESQKPERLDRFPPHHHHHHSTSPQVPQESMVDYLYFNKLYKRGDPFARMNEEWFETGEKKRLEDGEEDFPTPLYFPPRDKVKEDGIKRLLRTSKGYEVWLHGRDLRAELVDQVAAMQLKPSKDESVFTSVKSTSSASHAYPGSDVAESVHWYVAPRALKEKGAAVPKKEAGSAKAAAGSPTSRRPTWCWRADFVQEALNAAIGLGMEHPAVDAALGWRAVNAHADMAIALRHHVAVMCTDGQAQLWSPAFLQSLGVLMGVLVFEGEVRIEEEELATSYPELVKALREKKVVEVREGEVKLPVPKQMLNRRSKPKTPTESPSRLPKRLAYSLPLPVNRSISSQSGEQRFFRVPSEPPGIERERLRRVLTFQED